MVLDMPRSSPRYETDGRLVYTMQEVCLVSIWLFLSRSCQPRGRTNPLQVSTTFQVGLPDDGTDGSSTSDYFSQSGSRSSKLSLDPLHP